MADWEVSKTAGVCSGCGLHFQPKQEYYAGLMELGQQALAVKEDQTEPESVGKDSVNGSGTATAGDAAGFERRDFCLQCWETNQPAVFCFWKSTLPEPTAKKRLLVDDQVLFDFFERLGEETELAKLNFRFVLALILMRKRILKYEQTELRDGQEYWIMGQIREQKKHEVLNPHLDDSHIQEVSEQLSSILQSDL